MINHRLNDQHSSSVSMHSAQVVVHLAQGCEIACDDVVVDYVQVEVIELFAMEDDACTCSVMSGVLDGEVKGWLMMHPNHS